MPVALVELTQATGLDKALAEVARTRPQAIFVINSAVTVTHRAGIIDFALKNHAPLVGTPAARATAAHPPASLPDAARRAAVYVDKILNGATPGDLPIQRPTKFDLVINKHTAQALRLTIPQPVLLQADQGSE